MWLVGEKKKKAIPQRKTRDPDVSLIPTNSICGGSEVNRSLTTPISRLFTSVRSLRGHLVTDLRAALPPRVGDKRNEGYVNMPFPPFLPSR